MKQKRLRIIPEVFLLLLIFTCGALFVHAQTADDLRSKIDQKNKEIADLEKEIASYQQQITATGKQADTLQNALKTLELTRKKLVTDISLTQKKIDATTLAIESLKGQIGDKQSSIDAINIALAKSIRDVSDADSMSLLEVILSYDTLGTFWNQQIERQELHAAIQDKVKELTLLKNDLTNTKNQTEAKKRELVTLQNQLSDQKKIVEGNQKQTNQLLAQTKNQEANYKKLLADRETKRLAFQQELMNYESQLKLIIDPSSFPSPASGILSWPVDNPLVTQLFGDTDFARTHTQAYNGRGHNGIDLRASIGTPIKAALSGVVLGTGDTDAVCPGASYGKWILINHQNGLTTLYAHLSLIRVGRGQGVSTGDVIGYSGVTGYATGPHLHFSVYASAGVEVLSLKSRVCPGTYVLPVADLKAYLNPLLYLPPYSS